MDPVEIMLKEYETLRQESLNSMNNRNTIISFGLATVGAIFTGSIVAYTTDIHSLIPSLALIVAIPIINTFVLFMWLGEYERMQRAGSFIAKLERKINKEALKELLTWETHLRGDQAHAKMKFPYTATMGLLIGISVVSTALGLVGADFSATLLKWITGIALVIAHIGLYLYVESCISKSRS